MTERVTRLGPDLLRVLAPNPSAFTAEGTNTYLLGTGEACVIDPGPDDGGHLTAILKALGERPVRAIVVTHAHLDHSALAPALARAAGAPVLAFGDARAGLRGALDGGLGVDRGFRPDGSLRDGEAVEGPGWRLVARHTPGHMGNHLCLDDGTRLFSGDHAMGFATTLVSPPEGDMGDYMVSLERMAALGPRRLLPGHGEPVDDGEARLRELLRHRRAREAEILAALADGPAGAAELAGRLYPGLTGPLAAAARRTVLAHLLHLARLGETEAPEVPSEAAPFRRVG